VHRLVRLAWVMFAGALFPTQTLAAKLGGAYYVDDAEIGKPGSCEIESWNSQASNRDAIRVFSPACVVGKERPVEVGINLVHNPTTEETNSTLSLTGKTVPIPIRDDHFGVAIAGALTYDLLGRTINGAIVNVPMSYDISRQLRFNVNVGAQYLFEDKNLFVTGGVGVAWNFSEKWSVLSEVFALVGPGQTNPRFQSGIRYSPTKKVDWDLIYGRNLTGEGAHWITLGLTLRTKE
jgi:hypothetical protein